jgi:hypothetical protein
MLAATSTTIAPHVEAAKRLLRELEQHAAVATDVLITGDSVEFLAMLEKRQRLLTQLERVVEVLAQERAQSRGRFDERGSETAALIGEVTEAAAGALESHERLVGRVRAERDRLAAAVSRTEQPDSIANHYAATSHVVRQQTLSVTG